MSVLLRATGYARHTLRLRKSAMARREAATAQLTGRLSAEEMACEVELLASRAEAAAARKLPAHRRLESGAAIGKIVIAR